MLHTVYFSLGSNLGDKSGTIRSAIDLMKQRIGALLRLSSFLETEPWGFESNNTFVNAAACFATKHSPTEVLDITQQIERELGRLAKSTDGVYHDRPIDIDILLYDDISLETERLTIPHPLMYEREFVMIPLSEIREGD